MRAVVMGAVLLAFLSAAGLRPAERRDDADVARAVEGGAYLTYAPGRMSDRLRELAAFFDNRRALLV
jgi:hypothetical protein